MATDPNTEGRSARAQKKLAEASFFVSVSARSGSGLQRIAHGLDLVMVALCTLRLAFYQ